LDRSEGKEAWSEQLAEEAHRLLEVEPQGSLEALSSDAPGWQHSGARFLRQFYDEFRAERLPDYLFGDHAASRFGAQAFLGAYIEENDRLCVCPVCDETGFFTVSRNAVRTDIDHYFPKISYPHLSMHPFNLIPTCHLCNSIVKRERDPLDGGESRRRLLQDIWLPYKEDSLSKSAVLDVRTAGEGDGDFFVIQPMEGISLGERIEVFAQVFDLPRRWSERKDQIGEKLFRRMRAYSRYIPISKGEEVASSARGPLDELLCMLHDEDLGLEPFVFPMVWWLSTLINEELGREEAPFVHEIDSWVKTRAALAKEMQARGEEIRERAPRR
jgi:hypothetical protein